MGVNSLGLEKAENTDLLKTVKALLEESEGDKQSLMVELRKKEAEIQEKLDLISYLKGEKTSPRINSEVDPATSLVERKITEIEDILSSKISELGQVKASVNDYDERIAAIEERADKIVSLGGKTAEALKNRIEVLNKEIISREETISELKLRENIQKVLNKELSSKVRNVKKFKNKSLADAGE